MVFILFLTAAGSVTLPPSPSSPGSLSLIFLQTTHTTTPHHHTATPQSEATQIRKSERKRLGLVLLILIQHTTGDFLLFCLDILWCFVPHKYRPGPALLMATTCCTTQLFMSSSGLPFPSIHNNRFLNEIAFRWLLSFNTVCQESAKSNLVLIISYFSWRYLNFNPDVWSFHHLIQIQLSVCDPSVKKGGTNNTFNKIYFQISSDDCIHPSFS